MSVDTIVLNLTKVEERALKAIEDKGSPSVGFFGCYLIGLLCWLFKGKRMFSS
jgi:hypothetical protein